MTNERILDKTTENERDIIWVPKPTKRVLKTSADNG